MTVTGVRMTATHDTATHDPDRRREIAHYSTDLLSVHLGARREPHHIWEPGGNRIELCNAGVRLILAPDWRTISWTAAERAKGQAWGLKTIDTFHTHGTPVVP